MRPAVQQHLDESLSQADGLISLSIGWRAGDNGPEYWIRSYYDPALYPDTPYLRATEYRDDVKPPFLTAEEASEIIEKHRAVLAKGNAHIFLEGQANAALVRKSAIRSFQAGFNVLHETHTDRFGDKAIPRDEAADWDDDASNTPAIDPEELVDFEETTGLQITVDHADTITLKTGSIEKRNACTTALLTAAAEAGRPLQSLQDVFGLPLGRINCNLFTDAKDYVCLDDIFWVHATCDFHGTDTPDVFEADPGSIGVSLAWRNAPGQNTRLEGQFTSFWQGSRRPWADMKQVATSISGALPHLAAMDRQDILWLKPGIVARFVSIDEAVMGNANQVFAQLLTPPEKGVFDFEPLLYMPTGTLARGYVREANKLLKEGNVATLSRSRPCWRPQSTAE